MSCVFAAERKPFKLLMGTILREEEEILEGGI